jgi:hypothetical protein
MWRRVNRCFRGTSRLHLRGCGHLLTLVPRSRIFLPWRWRAILSSETSIHTRSTRRHVPEDGVLHSRRHENLKSYIRLILCSIFVSQCRLFPSDYLLHLAGASCVYMRATCPTHLIYHILENTVIYFDKVCVCAFFCVCVQVEALRRADHPPKESYRLSMIQEKTEVKWRVSWR